MQQYSRSSCIHKHRLNAKDRLRRIRFQASKVRSSADKTANSSWYREDLGQDPTSMTERQVFGPCEGKSGRCHGWGGRGIRHLESDALSG